MNTEFETAMESEIEELRKRIGMLERMFVKHAGVTHAEPTL